MSGGRNQGYAPVTEYLPDETEHRRQIARRTNEILQGNINCSVDVTLNASQTSTTITDPRIYPTKTIIPMALSANGAAAIVAGIWFDTFLKGSCVAHHASNAATDQNLRFLVIG